jgi:DNA polymerase III epsilon subunit-like protein
MIFDTETDGRPPKKKRGEAAPTMQQTELWPRVIEVAWSLCTPEGKRVKVQNFLISPDGWTIPAEGFWLEHGFSMEQSLKEGVPIKWVAEFFLEDLEKSRFLVAHNIVFDYNVMGAEFLRLGLRSQNRPFRLCTMELSRDYLKLPFPNQKRPYRFQKNWHPPRLEQLYEELFKQPFDGKHRAAGDRDATEKCFFELVRRGVIKLPNLSQNPSENVTQITPP